MDALNRLPLEVVLRILDLCSLADLANLTGLSRSWNEFIDGRRQGAIYHSRVDRPPGASDLSFLKDSATFERYYEGTTTFKELCRRQTLLSRNCMSPRPLTKEFLYRIVGDDKDLSLWHLDLKRRFIISSSSGDKTKLQLNEVLNVTDIDTQEVLWSDARYYKDLQYRDGVAAFQPYPNNGCLLEVWKTDDSQPRGVFRKFGDLAHDYAVKGSDLGPDHLCTVSKRGWGFVWNINGESPELVTRMRIKKNALGVLGQDEDVVMYCVRRKEYHMHDKSTGALLGKIDPGKCRRSYAIDAPKLDEAATAIPEYTRTEYNGKIIFPPGKPTRDRMAPLCIKGPVVTEYWSESGSESDSESGDSIDSFGQTWDAGILSGSLMVGLCSGGHDGVGAQLLVYPDWKQGLSTPGHFERNAYLIQLRDEYERYNGGQYFSVHGNRIMLRAQQCIYIISLNEDGTAPEEKQELPPRPSFCFYAGDWAKFVSQMQLFDDCAVMDFWVQVESVKKIEDPQPPGVSHVDDWLPDLISGIRILSFAPDPGSDIAP